MLILIGANGVEIESIVLAVSDGKNDIMRKDITNEVSSDSDGSMTPGGCIIDGKRREQIFLL